MNRRYWTKFVAMIMSLATVLSVVSVPAVAPLADAGPETQQVDQGLQQDAVVSMLKTLSKQTQPVTAKADVTSVPNRSLGVDVSAYQGTDLSAYARAGAKYAIVKTTEGTNWVNSHAAGQVQSAKRNGMMVMGYHFAHCGGNVSAARNEANYAISHAKQMGIPVHSYIAMDFEADAWGNKQANTNAAIAFMQTVRNAGYLPMFYSGAAYMNEHFYTDQIIKQFPGSLWVAAYKTLGRQDAPDFNYFPSRNGIAIWQFTDNLKGLGVDGNINVLPLNFLQPEQPAKPQPKPQPKPNPTYQTTVHFLDSQAGNREVGKQTVSGRSGDRKTYSVPNNYHANSGQSNQVIVSNNGNVNVYVSHNMTSASENRSFTRVVKGTLTNTDGTTATYQYSVTKQVPLTGQRDLVTGKVDWSSVPDFDDVFSKYTPNFADDAAKSKFSYSNLFDHIDLVGVQVVQNGSTQTINVSWKAQKKDEPSSSSSSTSSSSHSSSTSSSSSSKPVTPAKPDSSSSESHSTSSSSSSSSSSDSSHYSGSDTQPSGADHGSTTPSKPVTPDVPTAPVMSGRTVTRTIKFKFADGATKTVKQTATIIMSDGQPESFTGWNAVAVPHQNGEVANCAKIPAVNSLAEYQAYQNSAFARTYSTDGGGSNIVVKYTKDQTTKSVPVKPHQSGSTSKPAANAGSQMGTEARKELQTLKKNPAAGSKAKNMSAKQAQNYVDARNNATQMSADYAGVSSKPDKHNYVGDLPQTGDVTNEDLKQGTAQAWMLIAVAVLIVGLAETAVIAFNQWKKRRQ